MELDHFSNALAFEMGLKVISAAKEQGKLIAISIDRLNHNVFTFISDGLPEDKHDWLRRKANVAIRFEESSLAVKEDLINGSMNLADTFGLDDRDFVAKGGSIPIKVKGAGLIGVITVSGLSDIEDHDLIVNSLAGFVDFRNN
jgi:uncharacterized protein (UPF0303 family)